MVKLSIIIPAYNEENTIIELLNKVDAADIQGVEKEVIVVEDCSTDKTLFLLNENKKLYTELIEFKVNRGKGAAVRSGISKATGDYILFQDADLEYDPNDYKKMLEPVLQFNADVVIGSRLLASQLTSLLFLA